MVVGVHACAYAPAWLAGWMAGGVADGLAGAYLAGRAATYDSDFAAGAKYYTRALVRDPQNVTLMENLV